MARRARRSGALDIDIVRFEGGKAVERWGIYDGVSLLQQIGAMPEPAHA